MADDGRMLKVLDDLREAIANVEERFAAFSSKEPGAVAEASDYGEHWADEVRYVSEGVSKAAGWVLGIEQLDDSTRDDLRVALVAAREVMGSRYGKMLVACDHAGEDGGAMQDLCYELEDLYSTVCTASDLWREVTAAAEAAGGSLGTARLR